MTNTNTPTQLPLIERPNRQEQFVEFDSVSHLVDVAKSHGFGRNSHSVKLADYHVKRCDVAAHKSWFNGATFDKIDAWMDECPKSLLDAIERIKRAIEDHVDVPSRPRRKLRRNREDGDELDPYRVLHRRTDAWTEVMRTRIPSHVVRIAVNVAVSYERVPSELLYRGAVACALADLFTDIGIGVEIVGFHISQNPTRGDTCHRFVSRVPIKHSHEPMNVGTVAVALCEIGFFRLVTLTAKVRTLDGPASGNFGRPGSLNHAERAEFDIVIDQDVCGIDQAIACVIKEINKFSKV